MDMLVDYASDDDDDDQPAAASSRSTSAPLPVSSLSQTLNLCTHSLTRSLTCSPALLQLARYSSRAFYRRSARSSTFASAQRCAAF
jgi:hypothetical protein